MNSSNIKSDLNYFPGKFKVEQSIELIDIEIELLEEILNKKYENKIRHNRKKSS